VAEKTLLLKLQIGVNGQPSLVGFGRTLSDVAGSERRLAGDMGTATRAANQQKEAIGGVTSALGRMLAAIGATAALSALIKKTYEYNQDLEGTKYSIAGLLYANQKYVDSQGKVVSATTAWMAANAEATQLMARLQVESLKTAATVPQIADAFAIVYGAAQQAGAAGNLDQLVTLTTRLTQTANAFKVPMEQIRQEINSLMTGQITHDSIIAKRLGLTNEDVRQMTANHTLVSGLIQKTEAYAQAADAQANTIRGKLINTSEAVVAAFSRAFDQLFQRMKGPLDEIFNFFTKNSGAIENFVGRVVAGFDRGVDAISKFVREHRELMTDIASVAALAGAAAAGYLLIAGAIAVITSPVMLTIAGIVALALVWEKARKWGQIEVGGAPISSWLRALFGAVQLVLSSFANFALALARGLANTFEMIFGGLGEVLVEPFRQAVHMIASIPKGMMAFLLPAGGAKLSEYSKELDTILTKLQKAAEQTRKSGWSGIKSTGSDWLGAQIELYRTGFNKILGGMGDTSPLPGPAETVKAAWEQAKKVLSGMFPELEAVGKKAADALAGVHSVPGPAMKKLTEQQQKQLADFETWLKELAIKASGSGTDTLTEKILAIEATRVKAHADALEKMKASMGAISQQQVALAGKLADKIAGDETRQAIGEKSIENTKRILSLRHELEIDAQKDLDDDRIALVDDALGRELEQNRAANRQWAADKAKTVSEFYREQIVAAERSLSALEKIDTDAARRAASALRVLLQTLRAQENEEIGAIEDDKNRRNARSQQLFEDRLAEQTYGTEQWARSTARAISEQFGKIGEALRAMVVDSRRALGDGINGFLNDFTSGQADFMKSLEGLATSLAQVWTRQLANILASGENVFGKLKAMWDSLDVMKNPMTGDAGSTLDLVLKAGGFGAMVGGIFQKPGNNAGVGGAIGGVVGAIVGSIIPGLGTALGTVIGSALGTLVGSMIQKGEDHIRVELRNLTADSLRGPGTRTEDNSGSSHQWTKVDLGGGASIMVDEKGISQEARNDLVVQIRRAVHDQMKGWQSILDLFPEEVKKALSNWRATLNLSNGVEGADITDEGALGSLQDFLGNKLPKATFDAYKEGLNVALSTMGVGAGQIEKLFAYWGTLQGKELQDAVRDYVVTMLEAVDWKTKFRTYSDDAKNSRQGYTPSMLEQEAHRGDNNWLQGLDDIDSKMALTVASMTKLSDIDDIIAAQKEVNDLARQHWEFTLQKLREIDAAEKAALAGHAQLREQITLSDKTDSEKVNYFFGKLAELRTNLTTATDPAEISRLDAEMQRYIQALMGMGDAIGPENKSKLLEMLNDMDKLVQQRMEAARQDLTNRMEKPATMLEDAAKALMKAAEDLSGAPKPPDKGDGPPDTGRRPRPPGPPQATVVPSDAVREMMEQVRALYAELHAAARDARDSQDIYQRLEQEWREREPAAIAAAVRAALSDMALTGEMKDVTLDASAVEGEFMVAARDFTVTFIKRNPDSIRSRTQP
jgi:hypothetical protein